MHKQFPLLIALLLFFLISVGAGILRQSGSPGGRTNSPGDGQNCTACHSGTASSAENWIETNIPETGYEPGETYQITVTGTDTNAVVMGFELTAEFTDGTKTGTFAISDADRTQLVNDDAAVTHTTSGTQMSDSSNSWTTEWTAPENASETIGFYAAVNAANGDGTNNGDAIYTTSSSVEANATSGLNPATANNGPRLYPNPVNNVLTIQTARSFKKLTLYSLTGQQVLQQKLPRAASGKSYKITLPPALSGIYTITLTGAGGSFTQTLFKY